MIDYSTNLKKILVTVIFLQVLSICNGSDFEPKKQHVFKTKHSSRSVQNNIDAAKSENEHIGNIANLPMIASDQVSSAAVKGRPINEPDYDFKNAPQKESQNVLVEVQSEQVQRKRYS